MRKKKVSDMDAVLNSPVIGTRNFRDKLSDYLKQVYDQNQILRVGKANRPQESAMLVSSAILGRLVENATFHTQVYYDEQTKQYVAAVEEFAGDGVGDTRKEALEMALDNIESLVEGFFSDINWYLRSPKYCLLLPHYIKLKLAESREQFAELLGLR
jgi:predicted RNase H-like HicB family nuclease